MGLKIMIGDITDTRGNEAEVAADMNATAWGSNLVSKRYHSWDRTGVQSTVIWLRSPTLSHCPFSETASDTQKQSI